MQVMNPQGSARASITGAPAHVQPEADDRNTAATAMADSLRAKGLAAMDMGYHACGATQVARADMADRAIARGNTATAIAIIRGKRS